MCDHLTCRAQGTGTTSFQKMRRQPPSVADYATVEALSPEVLSAVLRVFHLENGPCHTRHGTLWQRGYDTGSKLRP